MEIKKHYASLSEAMRAGIPLRPQAFGELFVNGGSCALGAAMDATMEHPNCSDYIFNQFEGLYHSIMDVKVACPASPCAWNLLDNYSKTLGFTITHLNDDHRWTREAIADWLETEEEKLGYVTVSDEGFKPSETDACRSELVESAEDKVAV